MKSPSTRGLLTALLIFIALSTYCQAGNRSVLCTDGVGNFEASLPYAKIQVHVGATRRGALGVRSCEAILTADGRKVTIASDVPILDLDAFGVDMGLPSPVTAFQLKNSKDDCCMTYQIYSLQKSPRLLKTLTGGSFFSAADTDLDGRVEIWTDDAAATLDSDGLSGAEFDFAPALVLRFENGKLLDVSSQFVEAFDRQIAKVKTGLRAEDLKDFKNSDGRFQSQSSSEIEKIHRLRLVKAGVLEIVWAYLYSGREEEAWRNLGEMWPPSDVDRIRAVIQKSRASGLRSQLDSVSTLPLPLPRIRVKVFTPTSAASVEQSIKSYSPRTSVLNNESSEPEISSAIPVLATFTAVVDMGQLPPTGELTVNLVIDSAGKVVSAAPLGSVEWSKLDLMGALSEWKFVPAFHGKHAVASTMVKIFSLQK